jgi:hypothetical protein
MNLPAATQWFLLDGSGLFHSDAKFSSIMIIRSLLLKGSRASCGKARKGGVKRGGIFGRRDWR